MLKYFLLSSLLFFSALNAGDKVEIYATQLDSKNSVVEASGGVSVVYKENILTANRAIYDRNTSQLELFDNVRLNQGSAYKVLGNYARLNLTKKERTFKPFYMADKASGVWLSAVRGDTSSQTTTIMSGTLSGCDPLDPIWKIRFSSADYNTQTQWMNIYNAVLFIEDIPLFYTPYFGYSLDNTRRTGLLMPTLGYSKDEGVYYEQPIYIAEQNWWDLEFKPQIRTNRGAGIYTTLRFVDSKVSHGELSSGYFKEKEEYFLENELQNKTHYGFDIKYDNTDFINQWFASDLKGQSGLYIDINSMNDVDYMNLSSNNTQNTNVATQVLSRINMFYNNDNDYIGAYFKYYQDLTSDKNDENFQKLPTLHYHHYLDTFFEDHLIYSLDVQSDNITRDIGKTVVQTNVNLPITLQTSLFDEYLNVAYTASLYLQHSAFGATQVPTNSAVYEDGYIANNNHTLSASTQLTRGYEDLIHVIGFGVSYNIVGSETKNGYYEDSEEFCSDPANKADLQCQFYNISPAQEEVELSFTQYIYGSDAKQIIYHRLAQKVTNTDLQSVYGELENELEYQITTYLKFYNNMFFNYDMQRFSKIFNQVTFNKYGINLNLSHLYKDNFKLTATDEDRYTSYLTSTLRYTFDKHYSFSALYNYDFETKFTKNREIGFMYSKRCWDFGIRYSENIRPILTTSGQNSISDRYLYFTILLKPIMKPGSSSLLTYKIPELKGDPNSSELLP